MPSVDLTPLITALTQGFANLTAAIEANQGSVDLAPLTEQVQRVADALYVEGEDQSIANLIETSNSQVSSVIGTYSDGERVKVFNETPAP